MKNALKLFLLWLFVMMLASVRAQVVTDFDETYAQELLKPGTSAPDFQLNTPDGKTLKFSEFAKGKYVVIDFWASWCPDCRKDLPEIIRLYQKFHKSGVEFLGVSFDTDMEKWTSYLEQAGVPYPQVSELKRMNQSDVAKAYGVRWIPSIYLMLRDHASIESEKGWKVGGFKGHLVTIVFSDKKTDRAALPEKKYLQNLQGTEEMRDDSLIAGLSGKKKDHIKGKMTVFVALDGTVAEMKIEELSFRFTDEDVTFSIKGVRTLSTDFAETILEPEYNEEYHRRTLDSSVNIMKKKSEKKEEKHDEE